MAVPFGFSVGDFIATIGVLKDAIIALSDSRGASADYQGLNSVLSSLQDGLKSIQTHRLDASQRNRFEDIDKTVKDAQRCIDIFLDQISGFKIMEKSSPKRWSVGTLKRNLCKIEWALCKKDDIVNFQCELRAASRSCSDPLNFVFSVSLNPTDHCRSCRSLFKQ
jgi:hypothetical protein